MNESTNSVISLSCRQRMEAEMLHAVLLSETIYPWNPADPTATLYFENLEAAFEASNLSEDIFTSQWHRLSQQAEQLWSCHSASLAELLIQQFESRMPVPLLTQLAAKAQTVSENGLALVDQLVDCVQEILADWESDDLRVMARPLAMAMRDGQGEIVDVTLRSVRQTGWESLSELEQVRLSLAIARYALGKASDSKKT